MVAAKSQAKAGFSQYGGLEETMAVDPANPEPGGQQIYVKGAPDTQPASLFWTLQTLSLEVSRARSKGSLTPSLHLFPRDWKKPL